MRKNFLDGLSNLFINFSSAWFGLVIVTPSSVNNPLVNLLNVFLGVVFFVLAVIIKTYDLHRNL